MPFFSSISHKWLKNLAKTSTKYNYFVRFCYICQKKGRKERNFNSDSQVYNSSKIKQNNATLSRNKKSIEKPVISYQGEILFGLYPVLLALKKRKRQLYHLYIKENDSYHKVTFSKSELRTEINDLAIDLGIQVSSMKSRKLSLLSEGGVHQGVCLDVGSYPITEYNPEIFEEAENISEANSPKLWLLLNEIQDPMNVGAIFRSAYYFGVDKIFMTVNDSCRLSPTVSKASSGVLEVLDIFYICDVVSFLDEKKDEGWCIVSTATPELAKTKEINAKEVTDLMDFQICKPTILILGNESRGISPHIQSICDNLVTIKPSPSLHTNIDSLNVSVATGVLLYQMLYRQKKLLTTDLK